MSQGKWRVVRTGILAAAILRLLCSGSISQAANLWDGGAAPNANWSAANNWDNNLVPTFPAQLTFGGGANLLPNNDLGNVAVDGLLFDNTAGAFTIGGQAFTLGDPNLTDNRRIII